MFDLIHTDLMGPTRTPSYSGYRYTLVLVDDFSRYTWVYFLKEKSEALSNFVVFKLMWKRNLGRKQNVFEVIMGVSLCQMSSLSSEQKMVLKDK